MNKVKIITIIPSLGTGGAENVVKNYSININRNIFDFEIIVNSKEEKSIIYEDIKKEGIKVSFFGIKNKNYISKLLRFRIRSQRIYNYITENKPDIVHMHLSLYYLRKKQYKELHDKYNIKFCYTCHSLVKENFNKPWQKSMARFLISRCGMKIISLNKEMSNDIKKEFGIESNIIYNSINLEKYKLENFSKETKKESIGINKEAYVIGNVGRFIEAKNHKFMIDVFEEIRKINKNSYLLFVAGGNIDEELISYINKKELSKNVIILDNRTDVPELLKCMDVFFFPSKYEGFPVSLIEAQVTGIKCVVSDAVTKEAKINDNCVYLSLGDSKEAWIKELLENKKTTKLDRINKFDNKEILKQLEDFYFEMI